MVSYQIVILDSSAGGANTKAITSSVIDRVNDLGLDAKNEIKFLDENNFHTEFDPKIPVAAIYFGSNTRVAKQTKLLSDMKKLGIFILPIVSSLNDFTANIPSVLLSVNGYELVIGDPKMTGVVDILLMELKLIRTKRLAFISYKRSESRETAVQLYHSLDERSFEVFLDTHSIRRGSEFQPMLWDNMGDSDLVVFLDTPHAMDSPFVEKEISNAILQGIGILQLVWPGHTRHMGTYLCDVIYLDPSDFNGTPAKPDATSTLTVTALQAIISRAEIVRAQSYAARRRRLIGEINKRAPDLKAAFVIQSTGMVQLSRFKKIINIFPMVGHPDSLQINNAFEEAKKHGAAKNNFIAYDDTGMWVNKRTHLSWLNNYLPVKTLLTKEITTKVFRK